MTCRSNLPSPFGNACTIPGGIVIPNEAPFLLDNTTGQPTTVNSEPEPVLHRSSCVRHPPDHYTA